MSDETLEQRREHATGAAREAKLLYLQTKDCYFAVLAIAAARDAGLRPPKWATEILFQALDVAVWKHHADACEISLDAALGLKPKRGQRAPGKLAERKIIEREVLGDIRLLHACFDISIATACEHIHKEPDFTFARMMEDVLSGLATEEKSRLIRSFASSEIVRKKLHAGLYLAITTGDRLGYGVEFLEETYHRFKQRHLLPNAEGMRSPELDYHRGQMLLLSHTVRFSNVLNVPACSWDRDPLRDVPQRVALQKYAQATGMKSPFSAQ